MYTTGRNACGSHSSVKCQNDETWQLPTHMKNPHSIFDCYLHGEEDALQMIRTGPFVMEPKAISELSNISFIDHDS